MVEWTCPVEDMRAAYGGCGRGKMKKTYIVESRTAKQAKLEAEKVQRMLQQIEALKSRIQDTQDKWRWTSYVSEQNYKIEGEESMDFCDSIKTIMTRI